MLPWARLRAAPQGPSGSLPSSNVQTAEPGTKCRGLGGKSPVPSETIERIGIPSVSEAVSAQFRRQVSLRLTMTSTLPPGRGHSVLLPRHSAPGYYHAVPPGQNTPPAEALLKLTLMGRAPGARPARSGSKERGRTIKFATFAELMQCSVEHLWPNSLHASRKSLISSVDNNAKRVFHRPAVKFRLTSDSIVRLLR